MRNASKRNTPPVPPPPDGPSGGTPSSSPPSEPPRFDLSRYSEATRRTVWDSLAATHFGATAAERRVDEATGDWVETHSAEEAGLLVFFLFGSWLAAWRVLDEPEDAPEWFRYDLSSLRENPDYPSGLGLSEV